MRRPILMLLLAAVLATSAPAAANETETYMRAQALVNWVYVSPEKPLVKGSVPQRFRARVRRSGRLQSLGLDVRIGDMVDIEQVNGSTWNIGEGFKKIRINTYDIPAKYYPRFR